MIDQTVKIGLDFDEPAGVQYASFDMTTVPASDSYGVTRGYCKVDLPQGYLWRLAEIIIHTEGAFGGNSKIVTDKLPEYYGRPFGDAAGGTGSIIGHGYTVLLGPELGSYDEAASFEDYTSFQGRYLSVLMGARIKNAFGWVPDLPSCFGHAVFHGIKK